MGGERRGEGESVDLGYRDKDGDHQKEVGKIASRSAAVAIPVTVLTGSAVLYAFGVGEPGADS